MHGKTSLENRTSTSLKRTPSYRAQVFYDKFLCDKFYLLVCTRNFDIFFYDKCTCSKASMLKYKFCSSVWVNKENLSK